MNKHITDDPHQYAGLKKYALGFIVCIVLTLASFIIGLERLLTGNAFVWAVAILAVVQAIVQLVLFLHLGDEEKPRLNLLVFFFMILVLIIVVVGTLWIMQNLNYQMMPMQGQ